VKSALLRVLLALLVIGALVAVFAAYQHPAMLIDFGNLMYCG
jgi:hypothetical protein